MTFDHEDKTYELAMTRAGVRAAEAIGLNTEELTAKPQSSIAYLFFAALYSRYKMNLNKTTAILDDLLDSGEVEFSDLFEDLAGQYTELFGSGESE